MQKKPSPEKDIISIYVFSFAERCAIERKLQDQTNRSTGIEKKKKEDFFAYIILFIEDFV